VADNRYYYIKQIQDMTAHPAEAIGVSSSNENVQVAAYRGDAEGETVYTLHIANLGAAKNVVITGLPTSVTRMKVVRTTDVEQYRDMGEITVTGGSATIELAKMSFTSLMEVSGN